MPHVLSTDSGLMIELNSNYYFVANSTITNGTAVPATLSEDMSNTTINLRNGFILQSGTIDWQDPNYTLPIGTAHSRGTLYGAATLVVAPVPTTITIPGSADIYTINSTIANATQVSVIKKNGTVPDPAITLNLTGGFTLTAGTILWSDTNNPRITGDITVASGATLDIVMGALNLSGTHGTAGGDANANSVGSNGADGTPGKTLTVNGTLELWGPVLLTPGNGGNGGKGGAGNGKAGGNGGKGGNGGTLQINGTLIIDATVDLIGGTAGTAGTGGDAGSSSGGDGGDGGNGGNGGTVVLSANGTISLLSI